MRARMIEIVTGMFVRMGAATGGSLDEAEAATMALSLVGAAETLADWLAEQAHPDAEATASRLMSVIWLGGAAVLGGRRWRSAGV
jgi:hypothetical protein